MSLGVIVNANAKKIRRDHGKADRLRRALGDHGEVIVTRSLEELRPALTRLLSGGASILVSAGGDGALHRMQNELLGMRAEGALAALPPMTPTNGGTIDFVARKAGIRGEAEVIVQRLVEHLRIGSVPTREIETLELEGEHADGTPLRLLGFALAAGGVGQRFFEQYYARPDPGPADIVWVSAQAIASHLAQVARMPMSAAARSPGTRMFTPTPARVSIDGTRVPATHHGALHAGAFDVDLGGVFRVFPLAATPGSLHFHAGEVSAWDVIRNVPRLARGKLMQAERLTEIAGHEMVIEATDEPLAPIIDGERYPAITRLVVRQGPAIRVATP